MEDNEISRCLTEMVKDFKN